MSDSLIIGDYSLIGKAEDFLENGLRLWNKRHNTVCANQSYLIDQYILHISHDL